MGVKITRETVCDVCKKPVGDEQAKVGRLTVKTAGARGRGSVLEVAFHPACLEKITDTASKVRQARRRRPAKAAVASRRPAPRKRARR